ncbi:MAG TPA: glycosyltransferase [Saprospiraceae bacterium]|nr:glycosyltransferase [Saprospiraceae bacterium]
MRFLVSVIIPNYNKRDYLTETLPSVFSQTTNRWEVIVIDDGSTDGSLEILEHFKDQISIYHRQRLPKGGSTCRNIGLRYAKGEYVIFLDADDLLAAHCVQQRIEYMQQHPHLDFAVFPIGTFYKEIGDSKREWIPAKKADHSSQFLRHDLPWHTSSTIWKKRFLEKLGGFDERYPRLQDVELHTRALLATRNYAICESGEIDFFYRIDQERSSNIYDEEELNKRFLHAVSIYLEEMFNYIEHSTIIEGQRKKQYKTDLIGTYFSALRRTLTSGYRLKRLSREAANQQLQQFIKENEKKIYISNWKRKLIESYVFLFRFGFWRIKGFNRLIKILVIK